MIDSFVEKVKKIFSEDSLVNEDPQMLKGMVEELHKDLELNHIHYADVISELNHKLDKIEKAIKSNPKDIDSLLMARKRTQERIDSFEKEHLDKIAEKVERISKAELRFDVLSKAEHTRHPFARFNFDGENPFEGETITPSKVTEFIKSLHPDFIEQVYMDDKIHSVDVINNEDFRDAVQSLQKGIELGILKNGQIEKAKKNISNLVPVRKRAHRKDGGSYMTTVWMKRDEAKKLSKKSKAKIIERSVSKKAQKEGESFARPGDKAVVNWIGSNTGKKYRSTDLRVKEINPESIVFEFDKVFWTQNPDANFYAYKKGSTIEIPRTHLNTWKKDLSFELMGVDIEQRKKERSRGISEDKIRILREKGIRIDIPNAREQSIRNFNHHFQAFNFERFFDTIKSEYQDAFGDKAKPENGAQYRAAIKSDGTFGFSANIPGRVTMSRTVNLRGGGRKSVYHSYFVINKVSDRGTGLGKKALHALYKEYKDAGITHLGVTPAWVGKYTWGRLGFYTNQSGAQNILGKFRSRVGQNVMIKPNYVGMSDDREWKVEGGKPFVKEGDEWVDVSGEKVTVPENTQDYQGVGAMSGEISRYKHNPAEDSLVDYGESKFHKLTESDYNSAKKVFDSFYEQNPSNASFPVRLFCDVNQSNAGKAAMVYGPNWSGHIDLEVEEQRKAFEKAIGYKTQKAKKE